MTIRVLHTEWSDGWGGQEIRIIEEMSAVREQGVEVMLACRKNSQIRRKALERGIPVFTFPFQGNTDLRTLWGLVRLVHSQKIDIVNTHSGKDTWVGGLAAKLSGAKFIRTRHLSNPINPSRFNFINELADFIITTGESVREDMIRNNRIAPEKIRSIPTGVDEKRFSSLCCDRQKARKKLKISPNQIAIGNLAVLRSFKRHDLIIETARRIVKKYPEAVFLIAGEGPQRPSLERLIKQYKLEKKVYLLGYTDKPEEFLRALDIFLFTSDSKEGVPQSLIQALMMDLPSIATNVGSVEDLWNGENFTLINSIDPDSISKEVEKEIFNLHKYKQNHSSTIRDSVKFLSKDQMANDIINVYKKVLNK